MAGALEGRGKTRGEIREMEWLRLKNGIEGPSGKTGTWWRFMILERRELKEILFSGGSAVWNCNYFKR